MIILLVGAPGAGKGSQGYKIVEHYDITHISTGDIFRGAIKSNAYLGDVVKKYVNLGQLVPDEITNIVFENRLNDPALDKGFLLDGYPRNVQQAEVLDKILENRGSKLDYVLNIQVPFEILTKRIVGRRVCRQCGETYHVDFKAPSVSGVCDKCGGELYQRKDDNEETVKTRLDIYQTDTLPLLDYYKSKGLLVDINGDQSYDEVFVDIKKVLGE